MRDLIRKPWFIVGVIVVAAVGFYLFRPDTLFLDAAVDESLEDAFATASSVPNDPPAAPTTTTVPRAADAAPAPTTTVPEPTTTAVPAGPVVEGTGLFYGIDHRAVGTATIYEQDGARILRLEDDTDIQNGPDLYVWLVPTADYEGGTPGAYVDLGRLKGNVGGQNYDLPADFDPTGDWHVLVWCLRFSVPFAAAPLA
jgi:hypothetical protein